MDYSRIKFDVNVRNILELLERVNYKVNSYYVVNKKRYVVIVTRDSWLIKEVIELSFEGDKLTGYLVRK